MKIPNYSLPAEVEEFLHEVDLRIDRFHRRDAPKACGFVASDFVTVYRALRAISEGEIGPHRVFCEWGSGFGVIACLAAMLDFDASGIEVDRELVDHATELADDFGLPVEFIHGSLIPPGGEPIAEKVYSANTGDFFWLETNSDGAYEELGLDPDDFDLIFAYPWPGEEHVIERLFDHFSAEGALLLTYIQMDAVRLRRKVCDA